MAEFEISEPHGGNETGADLMKVTLVDHPVVTFDARYIRFDRLAEVKGPEGLSHTVREARVCSPEDMPTVIRGLAGTAYKQWLAQFGAVPAGEK